MRKIRILLWQKTWIIHLTKLFVLQAVGRVAIKFEKNFGVISEENQSVDLKGKKIAVVAMYPDPNPLYLISMKNLVNGLLANDHKILAISNKKINESLKNYLKDQGCTILVRKNRGRDFGAYQAGIQWIERHYGLSNVERISLVNDTLIWMEDSTRVVAETMKSEWDSLFLNFEVHTHAQSFFLSFSGAVLSNDRFVRFWRSYVPLNYRRHTILKGEILLSEVLIKEGFRCKPYVDQSLLMNEAVVVPEDMLSLSSLGDVVISQEGGVPMPGVKHGRLIPSTEITALAGFEGITDELEVNADSFKGGLLRVLNQYCNSQAPHRIGLHLYVLLGIPMKADIYKCYPLSELTQAVKLRNPELHHLFMDFMSGKIQRYMEGSKENIKRLAISEI